MWWWNAQPWWPMGTLVVAAVTTVAVGVLILAAAYLIVRQVRVRDRGPEEILSARFAAGELGPDEYRERLAVLRETAGGSEPAG